MIVLVLTGAALAAVRSGAELPAALVVPLVIALAVGTARLRERPAGPHIHDRQLDLIVATGAGIGAAALVAAQLTGAGHQLGLLAVAPTAVAVLAVAVGTRRLWHARAVPAVLVLLWPAPWDALAAASRPGPLATGVITGVVVGLAVGLAVRTTAARRVAAAVTAAGLAAGASAGVATALGTTSLAVPTAAGLVALLLAVPLAGLLPTRRPSALAYLPAPDRTPLLETATLQGRVAS